VRDLSGILSVQDKSDLNVIEHMPKKILLVEISIAYTSKSQITPAHRITLRIDGIPIRTDDKDAPLNKRRPHVMSSHVGIHYNWPTNTLVFLAMKRIPNLAIPH